MSTGVFVKIGKTENNYAAFVEESDGFVCRADSFEELMRELRSVLNFILKGCRKMVIGFLKYLIQVKIKD